MSLGRLSGTKNVVVRITVINEVLLILKRLDIYLENHPYLMYRTEERYAEKPNPNHYKLFQRPPW